ncbi:ribosome biogenesis GTPase Der [Zhongshania sp.]|jgi:GTP-binding protein|uniref:ribosome biogenesis GTPase Der n=1 Tax=Zhongshania sp. TaxID=1971902 RepID=UPI001B6FF9A1|nr:ribosome biogenesis GTPase Der [Zhongshania sp.]MBQ0797569.1 ribosome biogenesis GTPase Der [Zhongshania sp.]|tara:strand:- start:2980 stop:4389 length:1410 start_codon:yes stop_codon:yes gene_type:complete
MVPVIALVGRPNVGKSTLFNRLTKSRDALVANFPGLTRDRKYGEASHGNRRYIVIDTGGINGDEVGIDGPMAQQSKQAIDEADAVLLMLDARAGLMPADEGLIKHIRSCSKPVFFVANKVDGTDAEVAKAEFYKTGAAKIYPLTATQGKGVRSLMDDVLAQFPQEAEDKQAALATGKKIAVVGRPNVGKSTLVNRMLGEDRVVVYDQPGTTRDSVYINYEREGEAYTLIDTAGIRKRKHISEAVEKFSIVKTLKAIEDANVVILVMDGRESIVDQDLHLLGQVVDSGRAVVVGINKWDGLTADQKDKIKKELDRRLQFIDFAEIHFISALHGTGVGHLYESVEKAYESATRQLQTRMLTTILEGAVHDHSPPMINGRRIKLRYAHPGGQNPPIIVIHGNQTEKVPSSYTRYLEKTFRRELKMMGTPIKIEFKTSENPFEGKKNELTKRQVERKQRVMRFAKAKSERKKR